MLRRRSRILSNLLSSPGLYLHRFLSEAVSPTPNFAVQEYLMATCGLARSQALKAYPKLSHIKSPCKPDAVLAFLAGLGLSTADVSAIVAEDPRFLCASVDRILAPNVVALTGLGLLHTEIVRLLLLAPDKFRSRHIVSKVHYYLPLFGSSENLLRPLKFHSGLLSSNLERVVKPNVAILRECGLGDCDVAKLGMSAPRMLTCHLERLRALVACAEGLGVPRGSVMFRHVLHAVASLTEKKVAVKLDYLKKTFGWSDAELGIAVCTAPSVLRRSNESLELKSGFLISDLGLEPAYIAHCSSMLSHSLEGRLLPRYYAVKFLKENRFIDHHWSYCTIFKATEKVFVDKFICPHKEAAPHLAEDYAAACRGQVPTRFIVS